MQPDLGSSYVEGLTIASAVDPGGLLRTVRRQGVSLTAVHGTPSPCPRS
jgi:hypothetical protein